MPPEPLQPFDLAALRHEQMAALVGETFRLHCSAEQAVDLTLAEAKRLGAARPDRRAPFSLIFHPADRNFTLPQQVYPLSHPQLGTLDIFLVPIRPDAGGNRLEAVFT